MNYFTAFKFSGVSRKHATALQQCVRACNSTQQLAKQYNIKQQILKNYKIKANK